VIKDRLHKKNVFGAWGKQRLPYSLFFFFYDMSLLIIKWKTKMKYKKRGVRADCDDRRLPVASDQGQTS
jgi:hypothetical protein